jgi:beta-1,4-N-acetylglucosaminyltransferase
MCRLIRNLSSQRYSPMFYVLAHSDSTSTAMIQNAELPHTHAQMVRIMRSREVKQSWLTTVFTTFRALLQSFGLVAQLKPDLIICNGPGTCVPICYVAFLYRVLGFMQPTIIFSESLCRVKTLSLSGKLLYPIADRFIVQWPQLAEK